MALRDTIRANNKRFLTSLRTADVCPVIFKTADKSVTVTVNAMCDKHSLKVDMETGALVKGQTARVTVHEDALTDVGFPTRITKNGYSVLNLKECLVTFNQQAGIDFTGKISEIYPEETIGIIVCELKQYE